jgi:hypothetical protein
LFFLALILFNNWCDNKRIACLVLQPEQRHWGQDKQTSAQRQAVYEAAKRSKPGRWNSRATRNWNQIEEVWLNPPREHWRGTETLAKAA